MSNEGITNGKKSADEQTGEQLPATIPSRDPNFVILPRSEDTDEDIPYVEAEEIPNDENIETINERITRIRGHIQSPGAGGNTNNEQFPNDPPPPEEPPRETHHETGGVPPENNGVGFEEVDSAHMNIGERFIARLQMNYNRARGERRERKAAERHGKAQNIDASIHTFEQTRHTLEESIRALQQNGLPGEAQIRMKMDIIDKKIEDLSHRRDREQTKFEAQDNKRKLFYNERDRIADTLIDHYEEKMQPMESTLEMIHSKRNQLDLDIAVMETYHREQETRLSAIEQRAKQLQNTLSQAGLSYRDVQAMVRPLATQVQNGRRAMQLEKREILQRRDVLQQQIARVDRKANPYRDKRDALARIKQDRPVNMTMRTRNEVPRDTEHETIQSHTRSPRYEDDYSDSGDRGEEPALEGDEENQEPQPTIEDDMREWLAFRNDEAKKHKEQPLTEREMQQVIDTFFRKTRYTRERDALDPNDFKKVLVQFYKSERASGTTEARNAERGTDPIAKEFDRFQKVREVTNNEK